eukprot:g64748.t1
MPQYMFVFSGVGPLVPSSLRCLEVCSGKRAARSHLDSIKVRSPRMPNSKTNPKHQGILCDCEAVIFDMDGVLIDSEPVWREVMVECFAKVGLHITFQDAATTCGLRIDQVVEVWFGRRPWDEAKTLTRPRLTEMIVETMVEHARTQPRALPGVQEAIRFFQKRKLKMAVASSSPMRLIQATLEGLKIKDFFSVVCSAEHEKYGKPHPAVYLAAAEQLGVDPRKCVAIEDSLRGVIAALAAEMRCIAIPEHHAPTPPHKFEVATAVLDSLLELNEGMWSPPVARAKL